MLWSTVPHTHLTLPLNAIYPFYAKHISHRSLDVPQGNATPLRQRILGWTKNQQNMLPHVILGRCIVESHPHLHGAWHSLMSCPSFHVRKLGPSRREHYWAILGQHHKVRKGPLACGEPLSWMVMYSIEEAPPPPPCEWKSLDNFCMTRGDHNLKNPMVRIAPHQGSII